MAKFMDFPDEVILRLTHKKNNLDIRDLAALILTNRRLSSICEIALYERALLECPNFEINSGMLAWAAWRGEQGTARKALYHGANPSQLFHESQENVVINFRVSSCWEHWQNQESPRFTQTRCRSASPYDARHFSSLHLAAARGHIEIMDLLLRDGVEIDELANPFCDCQFPYFPRGGAKDQPSHAYRPSVQGAGVSALHFAICRGQLAAARWLIEKGASAVTPVTLPPGTPDVLFYKFPVYDPLSPLYLAARIGPEGLDLLRLMHKVNKIRGPKNFAGHPSINFLTAQDVNGMTVRDHAVDTSGFEDAANFILQ